MYMEKKDFVYEITQCSYGVGSTIKGIYRDKPITVRCSQNTWFDNLHEFKFENNEFILVCRSELVTSASYHVIARMLPEKILNRFGINNDEIDLFKNDDSFGGPIVYTQQELELFKKGLLPEKEQPNISQESYMKFAKATQYMIEHGEYIKTQYVGRHEASAELLKDISRRASLTRFK